MLPAQKHRLAGAREGGHLTSLGTSLPFRGWGLGAVALRCPQSHEPGAILLQVHAGSCSVPAGWETTASALENVGNMTIIHQINSKSLDRRGPVSCGLPGWGFCQGSFLPMLFLPPSQVRGWNTPSQQGSWCPAPAPAVEQSRQKREALMLSGRLPGWALTRMFKSVPPLARWRRTLLQ